MKRKLFIILSLFLISSIYIFAENFPQKAKTVNEFIPKGWKEISNTSGDLNNDKLKDTIIVIEKEDKKNIKKNDGLGPDYLNLNPRILLILFKQKDGTYTLVSKNDKDFISSPNSEDEPTLEDTFNGISIKNNTLIINFNYFYSAGSWGTSKTNYIFRYQNNDFELIGYYGSSDRGPIVLYITDVNFSTRTCVYKKNVNADDDEAEEKFEVKTIKFKRKNLIKLSEITDFDELDLDLPKDD